MRQVTVVVPVHNEEKCLPYSLPSLRALDAEEYYVILDRCVDRSQELIEKWIPRSRLTLVHESRPCTWVYRPGWLRRKAYRRARNNAVLNTSADIILDSSCLDSLGLLSRCGAMVFGFLDHPWTLQCFLRQIYSSLTPVKSYSGLFLFNRDVWAGCENEEKLSRVFCEDTHLLLSLRRAGHKLLYRNTRSIHLRPDESPEYNYQRGLNYWRVLNSRFPKVVAQSVMMLRPEMLSGYIHARMEK